MSDAVTKEIKTVVDAKLDRLSREPDDSSLSHRLHDGMPEGQTRAPEYIYPTLFVILLGGQQEPDSSRGRHCSACCPARTSCAASPKTRAWCPGR